MPGTQTLIRHIDSAAARLASALSDLRRMASESELNKEAIPASPTAPAVQRGENMESAYLVTIHPNGCQLHRRALGGKWQAILTASDPLDCLTAAGETAVDDVLPMLRRLPETVTVTFRQEEKALPMTPWAFARAVRGRAQDGKLIFHRTQQHSIRGAL